MFTFWKKLNFIFTAHIYVSITHSYKFPRYPLYIWYVRDAKSDMELTQISKLGFLIRLIRT